MKYLVDTDWVIDHLNNVQKTSARLETYAPEGMAVSVITLAELYEGVYYSKDPSKSQQVLEEFLAPDLAVLGVDHEVGKVFGMERGRLRREGRLVGDFDLLIAATCLHYGLTLLTNNRRHYEGIKGLNIISL